MINLKMTTRLTSAKNIARKRKLIQMLCFKQLLPGKNTIGMRKFRKIAKHFGQVGWRMKYNTQKLKKRS